jgi:hypothetical protein
MAELTKEESCMAESSPTPPNSTFVVRLWQEWSAAESRWRGRIEHLQSSQRMGFQDLDRLLAFIRSFGAFAEDDGQPKEGDIGA